MAPRARLPDPLVLLPTVTARMSSETRRALRAMRLALGDITASMPISTMAARDHDHRGQTVDPASRKPVSEPVADAESLDLF